MKGTLNKLGISPNYVGMGKYKSIQEQFNADTMSPYAEEQLSAILNSVYNHFITHVSATRGIPRDDVIQTIDACLVNPAEFVTKGFLTGLKYDDEVEKELAELLGVDRKKLDKRLVPYKKYT